MKTNMISRAKWESLFGDTCCRVIVTSDSFSYRTFVYSYLGLRSLAQSFPECEIHASTGELLVW